MRDDIYGAIKNGLDRGQKLEETVQTLINSGYSERDVREVANFINSGAISTITPANNEVNKQQPSKKAKNIPLLGSKQEEQVKPFSSINLYKKPKSAKKGKIVFLAVILVILLGALVVTLLFRQTIVEFIAGFF